MMVTEGYSNDFEKILSFLDQKQFSDEGAKVVASSCDNAVKMVSRYLNIMKFFDMDDIIARKFVNNVKNMEHDLEEILTRTSTDVTTD